MVFAHENRTVHSLFCRPTDYPKLGWIWCGCCGGLVTMWIFRKRRHAVASPASTAATGTMRGRLRSDLSASLVPQKLLSVLPAPAPRWFETSIRNFSRIRRCEKKRSKWGAKYSNFPSFSFEWPKLRMWARPFPIRVTYHDACHALRELGIKQGPRDLLQARARTRAGRNALQRGLLRLRRHVCHKVCDDLGRDGGHKSWKCGNIRRRVHHFHRPKLPAAPRRHFAEKELEGPHDLSCKYLGANKRRRDSHRSRREKGPNASRAVVCALILQILPENRLRRIEAAIDDAHNQVSICVRRLWKRCVAAFPLQAPRCPSRSA